ncbi:MAG: acyl carrier protein [Blastocatellia bacterium]
MPIAEIKTKIKEFLVLRMRNHDPQDDEDIFAISFINSMFAMQLVMFVESEFNVTVEDEDLDLENFRTVNTVANFIEHKKELLQQV